MKINNALVTNSKSSLHQNDYIINVLRTDLIGNSIKKELNQTLLNKEAILEVILIDQNIAENIHTISRNITLQKYLAIIHIDVENKKIVTLKNCLRNDKLEKNIEIIINKFRETPNIKLDLKNYTIEIVMGLVKTN